MSNETVLRPKDRDELITLLGAAHRDRCKLKQLDLTALDQVLSYEPDDMTLRVETGVTLVDVQSTLAEHRQWLPIDPVASGSLTVGDIVNNDLSGPRRYAHGTIRDHVIGITVIMADGRLVKSGGNVVKNVAGFDLMRLFVGARGRLGIVADITFRLRPLPDAEIFLIQRFNDLSRADATLEQISRAQVSPVVLDMHNIDSVEHSIVIGFAGSLEDVAYQRQHAIALGFTSECDLSYEGRRIDATSGQLLQYVSVLPSKLCSTLASMGTISYIARAGNGIIEYAGGTPTDTKRAESPLMRRTQELFDPYGILPSANVQ